MSKRKLSKHRSPKHNYKAKLERCIMAVKSKQKAHCSKTNYKSFGCYNPWAVCRSSVKRSK